MTYGIQAIQFGGVEVCRSPFLSHDLDLTVLFSYRVTGVYSTRSGSQTHSSSLSSLLTIFVAQQNYEAHHDTQLHDRLTYHFLSASAQVHGHPVLHTVPAMYPQSSFLPSSDAALVGRYATLRRPHSTCCFFFRILFIVRYADSLVFTPYPCCALVVDLNALVPLCMPIRSERLVRVTFAR